MTPEQRLRTILAHSLSGQRSYASCDIPTRDQIDSLIPKIVKACDSPLRALALSFVDTWSGPVDRDEQISGADAVEFIQGFLEDCRAVIGQVVQS